MPVLSQAGETDGSHIGDVINRQRKEIKHSKKKNGTFALASRMKCIVPSLRTHFRILPGNRNIGSLPEIFLPLFTKTSRITPSFPAALPSRFIVPWHYWRDGVGSRGAYQTGALPPLGTAVGSNLAMTCAGVWSRIRDSKRSDYDGNTTYLLGVFRLGKRFLYPSRWIYRIRFPAG